MLHVGDLHLVSINGGKWCPHGHTSPTVKHTPAKESKVHNGGGPYPRPVFASLGHFTTGKPGSDMRFNVHNGEGPYSHPDVVSPAFLGALIPMKPHFPSPNLATKDLRDLLRSNLFKK
jgi:hypothetical protein